MDPEVANRLGVLPLSFMQLLLSGPLVMPLAVSGTIPTFWVASVSDMGLFISFIY